MNEGTADTGDESVPDAAEPPGEADAEDTSNSEAARYRRRLREAEQERDELRSRVESLQRAEVERRIGDALETPSDLWLTGLQLADIVDEDGNIDEPELDQVVFATVENHPAWRKRVRPGVDEDQGNTAITASRRAGRDYCGTAAGDGR